MYKKITILAMLVFALMSESEFVLCSEHRKIHNGIAKISERFTSIGAGARSSGAYQCMVFEYLKDIGTQEAYEVLKELVKEGRLNNSYLERWHK